MNEIKPFDDEIIRIKNLLHYLTVEVKRHEAILKNTRLARLKRIKQLRGDK